MIITGKQNLPVLLNGDQTQVVGHARVYEDGSISIVLRGPLGERFREKLLSIDTKSFSIGYEYMQATPAETPLDSNIHCVDGVDGLTPDMLRVRPVIEGRLW